MDNKVLRKLAGCLTSVLLLAAFILNCASCTLFSRSADDLYGLWESTKANNRYLMYISEDYLDIFIYDGDSEDWLMNTWSGTFTPPSDGFRSYSWVSEIDLDRSDSGYSHYYEAASAEFEYKHNKIYMVNMLGSIEFEKSNPDEHPGCMAIVENNERCLNALSSAQPLEYGEVNCFDLADDEYICCVEITNPNSFGIKPKIRFSDEETYARLAGSYIPAGATSYCAGIVRSPSGSSGTDCFIDYNIYRSEFDLRYPQFEIVDSTVITDDSTGLISEVIVNVEADWIPEPRFLNGDDDFESFSVYVIFFRDDEVVGAGVRLTNYGAIDEPISVTNISAVSEYDRYEVYFGRLSKGHNAPRISYLEY